MNVYHFCLAFDSPDDSDFIDYLQKAANKKGLSTYLVSHHNLDETIEKVYAGHIEFLAYYDRASDTSPTFLSLYSLLNEKRSFIFQTLEKQLRAADKAIMHEQFVKHQIPVPHTLIALRNATCDYLNVTEDDLIQFKKPFVIKPAINTGASLGVNPNAFSLNDVSRAWHDHPDEKYLIQEKIKEQRTEDRKFWFRAFYICDEIKITWWDPDTFHYQIASEEDIVKFNLKKMNAIMQKIAQMCQLRFFSTEFAIDESEQIFAIDYVNEICDMRIQSKHVDGVPDDLVITISDIIVNFISQYIDKKLQA